MTPTDQRAAAGRVRVLPPELANRIAAGEVVERPASVVKELLENALDAGARTVRVKSEAGGTVLIRVTDDGRGMTPQDAALAVKRHATSKLRSPEDLMAITTFGFRGEALPSIAAVARLSLTTRSAGDEAATRVEVQGGVDAELSEAAAPAGTTVEVADLFFNVPARRKFLRRVATEASKIVEECVRVALCRPDVSITVKEDARVRLSAPRVESLADRLAAVLGRKTASQLVPFDRPGSAVRVWGFISPPTLTRSNGGGIYTYVNGRFVKDRRIQRALLAGYRGLIDRGRFPIAVLFLELDPAEVDVNVHPAKHELRFKEEAAVTGSVVLSVQEVVARSDWVGRKVGPLLPGIGAAHPERVVTLGAREGADTDEAGGRLRAALERARGRQEGSSGEVYSPMAPWSGASWSPHDPAQASLPVPEESGFFGSLKVLGVAGACFIVCEGSDGLVLIDQHAAHERVVFERIRAQTTSGSVELQHLLVPLKLDLGVKQRASLDEHAERLAQLGVETESFGGNTVLVKTVPAILAESDFARLLPDLLDDLQGEGAAGPCAMPPALQDRMEAIAATVACHGSVRAGQVLGGDEIRALLRSLDETRYAASCPHGRPTLVELPFQELARRFRRT